jgi:HAMP domain-containing protein
MKLSTRVTLLATMLVAPMLGGARLRGPACAARRSGGRPRPQAREVADALRAGIEPLSAEAAVATLTERAWRARERDDAFQLEILKAPDRDGRSWQTSDPGWLVLLQAAEQDAPVGPIFERADGRAGLRHGGAALRRDGIWRCPGSDPARRPVAVLGMKRSTDYIGQAVRATARRMFPLFLAVVVFLAVGVLLALRAGVTAPLRACWRGSTRSAKGDLSRVLLAEREDDIGTLANRFNAMTGLLREAREEMGEGPTRGWRWRPACASRRSWRPSVRWRPRSPTRSARR